MGFKGKVGLVEGEGLEEEGGSIEDEDEGNDVEDRGHVNYREEGLGEEDEGFPPSPEGEGCRASLQKEERDTFHYYTSYSSDR